MSQVTKEKSYINITAIIMPYWRIAETTEDKAKKARTEQLRGFGLSAVCDPSGQLIRVSVDKYRKTFAVAVKVDV